MEKQRKQTNNNDLMRYAGLGAQFFVALGLAVFAGYKIDKWFRISIPLLVWLFPFIVLCAMIYNLIKETSKRNNKDDKQ
jgi:hypothetical protein